MAAETKFKTSFESNSLNRKQIAMYIRQAKSPAERVVWRNLLNSEAFHKAKNAPKNDTKDSKKK